MSEVEKLAERVDALEAALREAGAWLGLFEARGFPLSGQLALMSRQTGIRDITSLDILSIRKVRARIDTLLHPTKDQPHDQ